MKLVGYAELAKRIRNGNPSDNALRSSAHPTQAAWEEYAKTRIGQVILWRVMDRNEHGQAFSEVRRLTIE